MSNVSSDTGRWAPVMEWLLRSDASHLSIRLYATLGLHADFDSGRTVVKRQTLAKEVGCSEKTVDRAIKELVDRGALVVEERFDKDGDRAPNGYTVIRANPDGLSGGGVTSVATGGVTSVAAEDQINTEREKAIGEGQDDPTPPAKAKAERPRNIVWDALVAAYGEPLESERSEFGKTASELREWFTNTGSPETEWAAVIAARVAEQDEGWRTHRLLRTRWSDLGAKVEDGESGYKQAICDECDGEEVLWLVGNDEPVPCPSCSPR